MHFGLEASRGSSTRYAEGYLAFWFGNQLTRLKNGHGRFFLCCCCTACFYALETATLISVYVWNVNALFVMSNLKPKRLGKTVVSMDLSGPQVQPCLTITLGGSSSLVVHLLQVKSILFQWCDGLLFSSFILMIRDMVD